MTEKAQFRQYDLWWAELPEPAGHRPVLLLSRDSSYTYLNKFLAVEITTTIRGIAVELELGQEEGLSKRCVANFDNIRTINRLALTKRIGSLGERRRVEAKRAVGHALAWDELSHV
ncbi:MAG: type II toxin-antitoxin system PemK/MazF family toxin [Bryobacteraceae bacterium]